MTGADDQAATIAFLSRGEAYGRPGDKVARVDTHASVVFLTGERAFKLKRAVKFSYLDYSTAAKREAMCRAELKLNRRTAPQLYLGVRAVTRRPDGALSLDGKGEPFDWLLEMRRFGDDDLFDKMAERNALTPALMRELADEIARFHAAAEPCDGGFDLRMRAIATENLDNLRRTGNALDQAKIAALAKTSEAMLSRNAAPLRRRPARRCHGDLHLRNICLIDGKPVPFDGIEFNNTFICIDPLYDLAFLLMDLDHRGHRDFASIVANRYFDVTGEDAAALALLPLYLSVRAGVRAHVSIAALARQGDAASKAALAAEAARYLDAALGYFRPVEPRLIAVGGLSGSGKSTVARALAADFAPPPGARLLRSDVLRKRLFGVAPETRLPPSAYDRASNDRTYAALYDAAARTLGAGYTAIADAAFLDPEERGAIAEVAARAGVPFTGLWLDAPAYALRQRIAARKGDASDADQVVLDFQLGRDLGPLTWTQIAAGDAIDAVIAGARRYLFSERVHLESRQ